jgi:hypothetical protein
MRYILPLLALVCLPQPARAADAGFCRALDGLKQAARISGKTQRVSIMKTDEQVFACRRAKEIAAQERFCSAAAEPVGTEFTHVFPWLVHDCLVTAHISPAMETVDAYTGIGRSRISHMQATWPDGARLDIRFTPAPAAFDTEPQFKDYLGIYELTIEPR